MRVKVYAIALLVGAFLFSHAKAASNNSPTAVPKGNGISIEYGTPRSDFDRLIQQRRIITSGGEGGAILEDLLKGPIGPRDKTMPVKSSRKIDFKTASRAASRAGLAITAGMVIYQIYEDMRIKPDGTGGWEKDPGQDAQDDMAWVVSGLHSFGSFSTPQEAASARYDVFIKQGWPGYSTQKVAGPNCSGTATAQTCVVAYKVWNSEYSSWYSPDPFTTGVEKAQAKICPEYQKDGVLHPKGGPRGADGKCPTGQYAPITKDEAATEMEKNGDKTKIVPILEEIGANDPGKDIEFSPAPTVQVEGPAKIESEPRVKTETGPNGETKTTTTKDVYNITYNGNSYSWTVSTVTINSDGSSSEETDPEPVTPPADPELGPVPDLYEQKYPDGLAGVWNAESAGLKNTPIFQFLQQLNPNLGSGGCPVWQFNPGRVLGIQVGGDMSIPCGVWSFLRGFFVICALFAARKMTFGG